MRWVRALVLLLVGGCALQELPSNETVTQAGLPGAVVPETWQAPAGAGMIGEPWLMTFDDARLDELVSQALAYNPDLMLAVARVDQAAAALQAAGGKLQPAVNLLGKGGGKLGGDFTGTSGVLLSAAWEMDIWGRLRNTRRAASAGYLAASADLIAARQSIAALVAKSWFVATEALLQHQIAEQMVSDTTQLVSLAEDRQRIGPGSELDVTLAQQQLQSARDAERQLALAYQDAQRAVEVLTGRYPAGQLGASPAFDRLVDTVPAGMPSELLLRRPDVLAARQRIDAAFANVEAAKAARFPTLSLTAGLSHISSDLFVLDKRDDVVKSVGGTLYLPIFDGGQLVAQVEARTADQRAAVALWAKTGLNAFSEVESALAANANLAEREPILTEQMQLSERALELERVRYRVGSSDLRAVLQQQLASYGARTALVRVQAERRIQRVNLYLALGGDFGAVPTLPPSPPS
jgi:NodT family efflux transporter outer membrane factor (OMF) lipoprotein